MLIGVNPLRAEVNREARRLKGCAVGSAPNAVSRFQQHYLPAGIQEIASGRQARETSTDDDYFYLLHVGMLHAHSLHRHIQASSGVCFADTRPR